MGTVLVVGVGPGLGMSVAHRFGREGHRVALVSRTGTRHAGYVAALAEAGVDAEAFVADVRDRAQLASVLTRIDAPEIVYYGPAALDDPGAHPTPIAQADAASVRAAMTWVYAAVDLVGLVLPAMLGRGRGGLLFAGGLSSVVPMPALGNLALSSAALRNYAVTLNAATSTRSSPRSRSCSAPRRATPSTPTTSPTRRGSCTRSATGPRRCSTRWPPAAPPDDAAVAEPARSAGRPPARDG